MMKHLDVAGFQEVGNLPHDGSAIAGRLFRDQALGWPTMPCLIVRMIRERNENELGERVRDVQRQRPSDRLNAHLRPPLSAAELVAKSPRASILAF